MFKNHAIFVSVWFVYLYIYTANIYEGLEMMAHIYDLTLTSDGNLNLQGYGQF